MKYTITVLIRKPIEDCFRLLQDHESRKHWHLDLTSFEHLCGLPNEVGGQMKLNYTFGKRNLSVIETVTHIENNKTVHYNFDSAGMHNIQENQFKVVDDNSTLWTCNNEFIPTTFSKRLMLLLMPKAIKLQSEKYLYDFKNYIEIGKSVKNYT